MKHSTAFLFDLFDILEGLTDKIGRQMMRRPPEWRNSHLSAARTHQRRPIDWWLILFYLSSYGMGPLHSVVLMFKRVYTNCLIMPEEGIVGH